MNAPAPLATRPDPVDLLVWLAGLFAVAPTPETVAAARSEAATVLLEALASDPQLGPGARKIAAALANPVDDATLATRLSRAFGLLFVGIGGPSTVSPYESVWRSGHLMQAATGEMDRLLADHGLSAAATGEAADHLSVELMLCAHLTSENHPDADALRQRLADWVPDFAMVTIQRDDTGYFAGAALMLAALVRLPPATRAPQAYV